MTFRVYRDRQGYWRWRLESANNRIIADSGEGYFNRRDCVRGRDTTPPGRAWTLASTMSCLMRAVIFRLDFRFLGRREAADGEIAPIVGPVREGARGDLGLSGDLFNQAGQVAGSVDVLCTREFHLGLLLPA